MYPTFIQILPDGTTKQTPVPGQITKLPRNSHGWPIPFFVRALPGETDPDFRIADAAKVAIANRKNLCSVCGQRIRGQFAFVVGPMCAINRISGEAPCHEDCAIFSCLVCPFLSNPGQTRRTGDIPEESYKVGLMVKRNPGVNLIWVTRTYSVNAIGRGLLFEMGPPERTTWLRKGVPATREEVMASIDSGLPLLRSLAEREATIQRHNPTHEGPDAVALLEQHLADAMRLLPAALPDAATPEVAPC